MENKEENLKRKTDGRTVEMKIKQKSRNGMKISENEENYTRKKTNIRPNIKEKRFGKELKEMNGSQK